MGWDHLGGAGGIWGASRLIMGTALADWGQGCSRGNGGLRREPLYCRP